MNQKQNNILISTIQLVFQPHSSINQTYFKSFKKATNELIGKVPHSTKEEMEAAVASSKVAYKSWSKTTPLCRQQIMFRLQNLIKENMVT